MSHRLYSKRTISYIDNLRLYHIRELWKGSWNAFFFLIFSTFVDIDSHLNDVLPAMSSTGIYCNIVEKNINRFCYMEISSQKTI